MYIYITWERTYIKYYYFQRFFSKCHLLQPKKHVATNTYVFACVETNSVVFFSYYKIHIYEYVAANSLQSGKTVREKRKSDKIYVFARAVIWETWTYAREDVYIYVICNETGNAKKRTRGEGRGNIEDEKRWEEDREENVKIIVTKKN